MVPEYEVTLEQMLKARDERAEKQKELIAEYGLPLISFTVNIPGTRKNTALSNSIFREGLSELLKKLRSSGKAAVYQESRNLMTGSEAYVVLNMEEPALKELSLQIENNHFLGRLWDFDVIGRDERAVSRVACGYPKRKCLLCEEDAHVCARSRAHSVEELLNRIQWIADEYFQGRG